MQGSSQMDILRLVCGRDFEWEKKRPRDGDKCYE